MKNNKIRSKVVKESLLDYSNLANTLKENTTAAVRDLLSEAVRDTYSKILTEDDEDKDYDVEEVDDTDSGTSGDADVTVDDADAEGSDDVDTEDGDDIDDSGDTEDGDDTEDDAEITDDVPMLRVRAKTVMNGLNSTSTRFQMTSMTSQMRKTMKS